MSEQNQGPPHGERDEEVLQKLDGGLRRLLRMADKEILKAVEHHEARLEEKRQRIKQCTEMPPATEKDREAMKRIQRLHWAELLPHPIFAALVIDKVKPVPVKVRIIIHFTGNRDDLIAMGLEVLSQAHDIFTVIGTTKQLADLAAQSATLRMQLPLPEFPTVEDAAEQAEIDQVHVHRPVNPAGYHGNNVIVGIIDLPLDVTHHAFRDPAGAHNTRVRYMWVQQPSIINAAGNVVNVATPVGQQTPQQFHQANPTTTPNFTGLIYGIIYTDAAINTALGLANTYGTGANQICCTPETEEHGTHVAGIAAGNGRDNTWATTAHVGAADQATVVHVSNRRWNDAHIIDALRFIFAAADFHNLPVAANISLGGNWGPHVGNRPQDRFIDNELNSFQERVVVGTAGNDNRLGDAWGRGDGFRQDTITAGNTDQFTLASTSALGRDIWLHIWYTGPELEFQVSIRGAPSGWQAAGNEHHGALSGYHVDVNRSHDTEVDMRSLEIFVDDARTADPLTIELRNRPGGADVTYYAWVCFQAWLANLSGAINNRFTLSGNACCRSMLTVGASEKRHPPAPAAGETITDYSGAGPTVDGRIKPEIVAVGGTGVDEIRSANSNQVSGYVGMHGTSMSAPLVTGAVALLFEEARLLGHTLNHDTIKALLTQNANRLNLHLDPSQPGYVDTERNRYGYGRLRMIAPIDHMRPPVNVDVWVRTADDDYGEEPYLGGCFCGAPDISVFERGTDNEVTELTWGTTYDVRVTVRNLGDDNAVGTTVRLKYTRPWVAPNDWHDAAPVQTVEVPALGVVDPPLIFEWRPAAAEIGAAPDETHFCLLVVVDHDRDELNHPAPSAGGGSAWATNIKGTNNVALRNVHIQ